MRKRPTRKSRRKQTNGRHATRSDGAAGRNNLAPASVAVSRGIGLPAQIRTTHRYCESVVVNGTSGAIGTYTWSANGLFDPNITGTGHQPYGYDQFQAYYSSWMVERSEFVCEVVTSQIGRCGVMLSSESNPAATLTSSDLMSEPGTGQNGLSYATAGAPRSFLADWDLKARHPDHDPAALSGVVNSNPSTQDYYTFYVQALDGSTTVPANVAVCITYHVLWRDPITIASS